MERQPDLVRCQKIRNYHISPTPARFSQGKTTFFNNSTDMTEKGGLFRLSGAYTGKVYEAYFYKCHGSYGGAISVDTEAEGRTLSMTIDDVYFDQCVARYYGGAYNFEQGVSTVSNCIFKYNTAMCDDDGGLCSGGAIYGDSSDAVCTITNSVFYGNTAARETGGAICINHSDFTISYCSFLYTSDSLFTVSEDAVLTFTGTNFFGASVQKHNGSIISANEAKLVFINYEPITFTCSLGTDNTIELNNSSVVTLDTPEAPAHLIVNAGTGSSLVGETKAIAVASWLANDMEITCNGVTDIIGNFDNLRLDDHTLSTQMTFYGRLVAQNAYIEDIAGHAINFIPTEYSEKFGTATAGGDKNITGNGTGITVLRGTIYANSHEISLSALTYDGRIYGGNEINSNATLSATNLSLDGVTAENGMRINGASRITGDSIQVTSEGSKMVIGFSEDADGSPGSIFAGSAITGTNVIYNAGTAETIINSGNFIKVIGNGSNGNYGGTLNQGTSSLTVNGGTFWGRVYAGGYSMADAPGGNKSTADVIGNVTLNIRGGTFNAKVYGGCAADYDYLSAHNTSVHGDVTVNINASESQIVFNDALFAGSQVGGRIYGNTRLVLTGSADNISFGVDGYGRFYGGSQNEIEDDVDVTKFVSGTRTLEFNDFNGNINARFVNFDAISFNNSEVSLGRYNDLHLVDKWDFDVSNDQVDLTWNNTNAINSFDGDVINLNGWDGVSTCTFMIGSNAALKDFDKAEIHVYDAAGTLLTSGYSVTQNNGKLQIAVL